MADRDAAETLVRKTQLAPGAFSSIVLSGQDKEVAGDDGTIYIVHTRDDAIIGQGSQGVVVHADGSDGRRYAAKISYRINDAAERLAHIQIMDYLKGLSQSHPLGEMHYRETHLMPIYAAGSIEDEVAQLGREIYDVAIMPLCEDVFARRDDVGFEEIRDRILPQTAKALSILHEQGIVHRDVKPHNLYELDGEVVLGDFGISSKLSLGESVFYTRMNRGTDGYNPDNSVVSIENDWYALGYTLWTLYNKGVHPHRELIETGAMASVLLGQRPVSFTARHPQDEALGHLVMGLTDHRPKARIGYDGILRWLENPDAFRYRESKSTSIADAPYQFQGRDLNTREEIARTLLGQWDEGIRRLANGSLQGYFAKIGEDDLYTELDSIRAEAESGASSEDEALAKAISLVLDDFTLVCWKGKEVPLDELGTLVEELGRHERLELLASGYPSWLAGRTLGEESRVAEILNGLSKDAVAIPDFSYRYAVDAFRGSKPDEGLREAAEETLSSGAAFMELTSRYDATLECIGALAAATGRYGACRKTAMEICDQDADHAERAWLLLTLLDTLANADGNEDVSSKASQFAMEWSPLGYVAWALENTRIYEARDKQGKEVLARIEGFARKIDGKRGCSVSDVRAFLTDAAVAVSDLRSHLLDSPYMHELGLAEEGTWIAPKSADGYFSAQAYGSPVPRGYAFSVKSTCPSSLASWVQDTMVGAQDERMRANAASLADDAASKLESAASNPPSIKDALLDLAHIACAIAVAYCLFIVVVDDMFGSIVPGRTFLEAPEFLVPLLEFAPQIPAVALVVAVSMLAIGRGASFVHVVRGLIDTSKIGSNAALLRRHAALIRNGDDDARAWIVSDKPGDARVIIDAQAAIRSAKISNPLPYRTRQALKAIFLASCAVFAACGIAVGFFDYQHDGMFAIPALVVASVIDIGSAIYSYSSDADENCLMMLAVCALPLAIMVIDPIIIIAIVVIAFFFLFR